MNKIPEWQYPLYKKSDVVTYSILRELGKSKKYPKFVGSKTEMDEFVKLLITSQKVKDYRKLRDALLRKFRTRTVKLVDVLFGNKGIKIIKGTDSSWVIFQQDRRICELIDDFYASKIEFEGNAEEITEFVIRFLLSQLLQDWRGPLMAVLINCMKNKRIKVRGLNNLLKLWDYTKIFKN